MKNAFYFLSTFTIHAIGYSTYLFFTKLIYLYQFLHLKMVEQHI